MKNFLKKLSIVSNQSEGLEGSTSSTKGNKLNDISAPHQSSELKPFSAIQGWLNSVKLRNSSSSPPSSTNLSREEKIEVVDSVHHTALDSLTLDSETTNSKNPDVEEEYQIQLALELSAKEDPEAVQIEAVKQISLGSSATENTPAEVVAYRYWNYNALGYDDKILDGFYDLYGVSTEPTSHTMPSLVDLQRTPVSDNITWEAILVNKAADSELLKLQTKALELAAKSRSESSNLVSASLVKNLAALVSDHMGGPVGDPDNMLIAWRSLCDNLKATHGSMVLPLGSLKIGLARHRALLFKVLADSVGIPCRLEKGQQYTGSDDVAMNFLKIDDGREYIVDLMADPGTLIPSDAAVAQLANNEPVSSSSGVTSSFGEHSEYGPNGPNCEEESKGSSNDFKKPVTYRSNYQYSHARSPSWTEGVSSPAVRRMKVKDVSQYMIDAAKENPHLAQKLHDVLLESGVVAPPNLFSEMYQDQLNELAVESKPHREDKEKKTESQPRFLPPLPRHPVKESILKVPAAAVAAAAAVMVVAASTDTNLELPVAAAATATAAAVVATTAVVSKQYENSEGLACSPDSPVALFNLLKYSKSDGDSDIAAYEQRGGSVERNHEAVEGERISDKSTNSTRSDVTLDDVADCEIPWEDIIVGERIGLGSYGEVHRGDWHGTEVAVKRFLDQEISGESLEEFRSEVSIMKRVRHPNVVLFMGAVTRPPNLSIITEFLPRGSLYKLLHRPNNQLDERRRLRMALDAARGMNYLHNSTPVIVHRDLKSPNLLVDKNWNVKVCDFGLSRMKHSTFLSSRSTAGTAEWMAPEVLRNEPSDEKCDVYSFGVVLWELCTLKQPWGGMNPMQVVGAVGFQHRRLDIPDDMDPAIADLITKCWQTDPKLRPSFGEIMTTLKRLQKPINGPQVPRPTKDQERAR